MMGRTVKMKTILATGIGEWLSRMIVLWQFGIDALLRGF